MNKLNFILTGSSGRLGKEIIKQCNENFNIIPLLHKDIEITNRENVYNVIKKLYHEYDSIDLLIHTAAYTAVDKAEQEKEKCYFANVEGTRNVVDVCKRYGLPLFFISSDYVFDGKKGNYKEEDIPGPFNYYGLTKLLGEIIVRQYYHKSLVIRTSFKPEKWPYMSAFEDVYTSADYMPLIVKEISFMIENFQELYRSYRYFRNQENIFHIAGSRKSILELARILNPNVVAISKKDMNFPLPDDVSLNTDKWKEFKERIEKLHKNKSS